MNDNPIHDSAAEELIEYPLINVVEGAYDMVHMYQNRLMHIKERFNNVLMMRLPEENDLRNEQALMRFWTGIDHAYAETMYLY